MADRRPVHVVGAPHHFAGSDFDHGADIRARRERLLVPRHHDGPNPAIRRESEEMLPQLRAQFGAEGVARFRAVEAQERDVSGWMFQENQ